MQDDKAHRRVGLWLGIAAYLLWGVLPLYFKLLGAVPPIEIVANRIIWSLLLLAGLLSLRRGWPAVRAALSTPTILMTMLLSAALIAANWLIYIWAVVRGHLLEASLGYYLNPLVNVLLGVLLLKERLTRGQTGAVLLAALGVFWLAFGAASGLWISLSLALTFGLYGFVRKIAPVDALEGLAIETGLLAPLSVGYVCWVHGGPGGLVAFDPATDALLIVGGAMTAAPLLLFHAAAKRLAYSTMGFLQFIAPSLQFLLAVLVYGEPFGMAQAVAFAAIWAALAIFALEGVVRARLPKAA